MTFPVISPIVNFDSPRYHARGFAGGKIFTLWIARGEFLWVTDRRSDWLKSYFNLVIDVDGVEFNRPMMKQDALFDHTGK